MTLATCFQAELHRQESETSAIPPCPVCGKQPTPAYSHGRVASLIHFCMEGHTIEVTGKHPLERWRAFLLALKLSGIA